MIQKKICMLGTFAVGKTSLVAQYVRSMFSEKYLTTVGVKIDKKIVEVGREEVKLMLWDLAGEDGFRQLETSYVRGAAGYFVVADGTRKETLDGARDIQQRASSATKDAPFLLLVNKCDLVDQWEVGDGDLEKLAQEGWTVLKTSAKTGQGVEEAFSSLTLKMLEG